MELLIGLYNIRVFFAKHNGLQCVEWGHKKYKGRNMPILQLLTIIREVLFKRTKQHYPILDAVTLFSGMDGVYYKYAGDKLYVTLVLELPEGNANTTTLQVIK